METVYSDFNGMVTGFRAAYLLAALTCAVAAMFCVVRRREEEE